MLNECVMAAAMGVMKACLSREWILVKRNSFVYIFKAVQVTCTPLLASFLPGTTVTATCMLFRSCLLQVSPILLWSWAAELS